jgi:hypothetical protein
MSRPAPGRTSRHSQAAPDILVDARAMLGEGPTAGEQAIMVTWYEETDWRQ